MSKRKSQKSKNSIDMNELQLKSLGRRIPEFRTGTYMTEKDRPRKRIKPRDYTDE